MLLLPHESYCVLDFYLVLFHGPDHMLCLSWTSTEVPFGSIFLFFLRDNAIFSIMTSDSVTWASATRWCGLLIAYWALKHVISITNESMEFLNNQVYQWSVAPFNIIGNTRHMIALSFMDRLIHLCDECVDMLFWVRESIVMMDGQHLPSRWELSLHNLVSERMKLSVNICCSLDWLCDKGVPSHHIASVAS